MTPARQAADLVASAIAQPYRPAIAHTACLPGRQVLASSYVCVPSGAMLPRLVGHHSDVVQLARDVHPAVEVS